MGMVKPFACERGYLYFAAKRGDGVMADCKPECLRLRDGMFPGYIDVDDWKTAPVISAYNQGEVLWMRVPKTKANKAALVAASMPLNQPADGVSSYPDNYRRASKFIDFSLLTPHTPDFMTKIYQHKYQLPLMKLSSLPEAAIKDASLLSVNGRDLKADVGQITAGIYTVGPAGGDDYPTYGGAAGMYAAWGNLTGDLTGILTGNITETADALVTENLNGFTYEEYSNNPHNGDPTAGWQVTQGGAASARIAECEGPGTFITRDFRALGTIASAWGMLYCRNVTTGFSYRVHDWMWDGAKIRGIFLYFDTNNVPDVQIYNCVAWASCGNAFIINGTGATGLIENICAYDHLSTGINLQGVYTGVVRNSAVYDCGTGDFWAPGLATGRNNVSSDATAANGNWAVGTNNEINHVALNDVQSVNDAQANFFDILAGGPLDSSGEANAIAARNLCIRNRQVPNGVNGGTSRGPAEIITPAEAAEAAAAAARAADPSIIGIGVGMSPSLI